MADDWNTKKKTTTADADEMDTVDAVGTVGTNDMDPLGETSSAAGTGTDAWHSDSLSDTGAADTLSATGQGGVSDTSDMTGTMGESWSSESGTTGTMGTTGTIGASEMTGAGATGITGGRTGGGMSGSSWDSGISETSVSAGSDMPGYSGGAMTANGDGASSSFKEQAAQKGHELLEKGKETAGQALDRAKTEVKSKLSDQKERATGSIESATRALESTSQQFRDQNLGVVADYVESFSGQVRRVGDYLREKDMDELSRDVETFARQNPAVFIGGAFLIGVAVARFLRSSESGSPLDAFSRNQALVPAGQNALTTSGSVDAFGERPLTAHDYVPGIGVTSTNRPASA
jgi:hypothetical protein